MMFKVLPDATVRWRDVWVGAFGTAVLFTLGKFAISLYLGRQSTASAYGAAGSLVLILLWVYYSSLILFFGAEFTQVYARKMGSHIVASPNAVPLTEEARANQGLTRKEPGPNQPGPAEAPEAAVAFRKQAAVPQLPHTEPRPARLFAGALTAGFISGWIAHRRATGHNKRPF
jgi:membrane protein